jgi:urea transporter
MEFSKFIKTSFVGVGQIFLQDNGWAGLLITIGMFFSHWALGVTCILGAIIGTLTAHILKYNKGDVLFGLYGFNGSLAFMCVIFTFGLVDASSPIIWVLGAVSAVLTTLVMNLFVRNGKVAYTFPFVVTCWVTCWGVSQFGFMGLEQTTPALPDYTSTIDAIKSPFFAWAEVNFGANFITGIFIFLGIAIANPAAAMYSTAAATIGALFAHYILGVDPNVLANGIYGFSPILVACAFVGPRIIDFIYVIVGVLLAVLIHHLFSQFIATYTIGFIVSSWIMLVVKAQIEKSNFDGTKLVRLLNP